MFIYVILLLCQYFLITSYLSSGVASSEDPNCKHSLPLSQLLSKNDERYACELSRMACDKKIFEPIKAQQNLRLRHPSYPLLSLVEKMRPGTSAGLFRIARFRGVSRSW